MINDLTDEISHATVIRATQHDARKAYELEGRFDAVITSPPYPNRHDYSRVFHVELLFLGLDEQEICRLRYSSLRSHVEARPVVERPRQYEEPELLARCFQAWPQKADSRVPRMIRGYFEDMYLTFLALRPLLKRRAKLACVVGNVRHAGVMIPVDEILAEVAEQAGYQWIKTWIIRLRGNSAQQMGQYGRVPSRESVVFLERKGDER